MYKRGPVAVLYGTSLLTTAWDYKSTTTSLLKNTRRMDTSVWFENGTLNKKRSKLQTLVSAQPVLRFHTIFTEQSWSTDVFVLFQNSIRHEVQDLYTMLRVAAYRLDALQANDCRVLLKWLVEFGQMVSLYFAAADEIIYPAVLRRQMTSSVSVTDLRRKTKPLVDNIVAIHQEALEFMESFEDRDNPKAINFDVETLHQALEKLCGSVFEFVAKLERFFAWELEKVATIASKHMDKDDLRELEKRVIAGIVSYDVGEFIWGGIAQWVPAERKSTYLAYICRSKALRLRRKERKWAKVHKTAQLQFAKR